jgi:hypothetical protein
VGHRTAAMSARRGREPTVLARWVPWCCGCAGAVLAFLVARSRRTALLLPVQRLQLAGGAGRRFSRRVVTRIIVSFVQYDGIFF